MVWEDMSNGKLEFSAIRCFMLLVLFFVAKADRTWESESRKWYNFSLSRAGLKKKIREEKKY